MTRIAVIGAHGQVGQRLLNQIYNRGDEGVGIIRNRDHGEDLVRLGAEAVLLDIENSDVEALASVLRGVDVVVFSAGAGPNSGPARKRTVDYNGSVKTAWAADLAGVERMIQVSAMGVDEPLADDTEEGWRAYVEAKRDADANLRDTDLDWTIIRPGGLTTDEGTGLVTLGDSVGRGEIPRDDVAALILAAIDDDRTIGRTFEAISGDTPIVDAIDALVR
ncbi:SDR family oxidoreductase [Herbiconiux sp. L3-i23]|uniref:SDR family oxidoreductase n=1 Tax=Herbiconiux sp. L3-i23 TaxID=2905871 RepID=UPI0020529202|nr:SDR family oxidoreductase [Herbiconiux sp. L3-i23]BDI23273.1 NAD-dependent dehydratase [Herbiconiux sp. L3-i23]